MKTSRLRVVVTGLIAQHPMLGGVGWDYVQYPLGLQRLGHDVYYLEDSGEWPYNLDGGPTGDDWVARDCSANVAHLRSVMAQFGLAERWAYRNGLEDRWYGLTDSRRAEVLATADVLINVSGTLERPDEYRSIPRLVYIDSDPVFTQIRIADGDDAFVRRVAVHDVHFSFGESHSDKVPETPYTWLPTRQPIVVDEWKPVAADGGAMTTVMSWTSYKPRRYRGTAYGQKDVEFCRFLDLPSRVPEARFEVALGNTEHADWSPTNSNAVPDAARQLLERTPRMPARELLGRMGWGVVSAYDRCRSLDAYRDYVRTSHAEWSVAKHGYVQGSPGWFSCRSACYLAAGRPVVVQNTGFDRVLPVGRGLLAFDTVDEAVDQLREVCGNYERHSIAARNLAADFFDASRVLEALLSAAESNRARGRAPQASGALHQGSA